MIISKNYWRSFYGFNPISPNDRRLIYRSVIIFIITQYFLGLLIVFCNSYTSDCTIMFHPTNRTLNIWYYFPYIIISLFSTNLPLTHSHTMYNMNILGLLLVFCNIIQKWFAWMFHLTNNTLNIILLLLFLA